MKTIVFGISVDTNQAIRSLDDLKKEIRELSKGVSSSDIGSDEFDELSKQLGRAKASYAEIIKEQKDYVKEQRNAISGNQVQQGSLRDLVGQQKALRAELENTEIGTDRYRDLNVQLGRLTQSISNARAEQRDFARTSSAGEGSINQLSSRLGELRKAYRDLSAEDRASPIGERSLAEIQELDAELKELDGSIGNFQRNVGNYRDAITGIQEALASGVNPAQALSAGFSNLRTSITASTSAARTFIATPIGAAIAALAGIGLAAKEFVDFNREVAVLNTRVEAITNSTGDLTDSLREQATAISRVQGTDYEDTLRALSEVQRDFGVNSEEAFEIINNGLAEGGSSSQDFVKSIREYGGLLSSAGFSAQEFVGILNEGIDLGIYNDKLPDAIKEADISLREQTTSTADALSNAFGAAFSDDLLDRISQGTTTTRDALIEISEEAVRANLNQQQLAQLTADVFRGAGEDAGGAVVIFQALRGAISDTAEELTPLQEQTVRLTQLNRDLERARTEALKSDDAILFAQSLRNISTQIQTTFFESIATLRRLILGLSESFGAFVASFTSYFNALPRFIDIGVREFRDFVSSIGQSAVSLGEIVGNAITLDFDAVRRSYDEFRALLSRGFSINNDSSEELAQISRDAAQAAQDYREQLRITREATVQYARAIEESQAQASRSVNESGVVQAVEAQVAQINAARQQVQPLEIIDTEGIPSQLESFKNAGDQVLDTQRRLEASKIAIISQSLSEQSRLEQEALNQRYINGEINEQEYQDRIQEIRVANSESAVAIREQEQELIIGVLSGAASSFAQIAGEQTALGKSLAIVSATIDTYLAANRALALPLPPPFPQIAAAAAIASGLANVAKIRAQQVPGFATGGIVSGGVPIQRSNGDNVLITAKRGEVVLNEDQQRKLGGRDVFRALGVPGFNTGGIVPQIVRPQNLTATALSANVSLDRNQMIEFADVVAYVLKEEIPPSLRSGVVDLQREIDSRVNNEIDRYKNAK